MRLSSLQGAVARMISRPAVASPQASASRPLLVAASRTCSIAPVHHVVKVARRSVRQSRVLLSSTVPSSHVSPWFSCGSARSLSTSVAATRQPQEEQPQRLRFRTPSKAQTRMTPEELEFWQPILERMQRHDAMLARQRLDLRFKMGMSGDFTGEGDKKPNGWDVMLEGKVAHPKCVVLVRVGKFYEAAGIDAIMLVEHCGVNFMGGKLSAGVPLSNIHQTVKQLVRQAGLEVAVYEETGEIPGGMKIRDLAQVVTLENPQYLYNCAEAFGDIDVEVPPLHGVAVTSRCITVYSYSRIANTIMTRESLSPDMVWGAINADRSSRPIVYLHVPLDAPQHGLKSHSSSLSTDAQLLEKHLSTEDVALRRYRATDALEGFSQLVRKAYNLPGDTVLPVQQAGVGTNGVRPLYFTTAAQLGLIAVPRGVPVLVDYLVPDSAVKVTRDTLTKLLTEPPPYRVTAAIRDSVRLISDLDEPLPAFFAGGVTTPDKVLTMLGAQAANARAFQDLKANLEPVIACLSPDRSPGLAAVVDTVWPWLNHTTNTAPGSLTQQQVLEAATAAVKLISQQVAPAEVLVTKRSAEQATGGSGSWSEDEGSSSSSSSSSSSQGRPRRAARSSGASGLLTRKGCLDEGNDAINTLADSIELWIKRVTPAALGKDLDPLAVAGERLTLVVSGLLLAVCEEGERKGVWTSAKALPSLVVDTTNAADSGIYLKLPTEAAQKALKDTPLRIPSVLETHTDLKLPEQRLEPPPARSKGKGRSRGMPKDLFTCKALEHATGAYLGHMADVNALSIDILKELCETLSQNKALLAAAMQLGILLTTLLEHSRAARAAGWTVPLVGSKEQTAADTQTGAQGSSSSSGSSNSNPGHDGVFRLEGLWPYWMSGSDLSTVKNDVALDGFMLLTGPNMAGKSTVLRSVAAAALLGSVGLAIPAAPGSVLPLLDAVMLRTFSGDSPQEGLSAYGVEMTEMGTVLRDVRPSSLVLVDELGKGTEVVSGTALAAGILSTLAASGCRGVFATHLHLLVELMKGVPNLDYYKMDVVMQQPEGDTGLPLLQPDAVDAGAEAAPRQGPLYRLRPTWRLLPGTCCESMAFVVAQDCQLPAEVLALSEAAYDRILNLDSALPGYVSIMGVVRTGKALSHSSSSSSTSPLSSFQQVALTGLQSSTSMDEATAAATADSCLQQQQGAVSGVPVNDAAVLSAADEDDLGDIDGQLSCSISSRYGQLTHPAPNDSSSGSSGSSGIPFSNDTAQQARERAHGLFAQVHHLLREEAATAKGQGCSAAAAPASKTPAAAAAAETGREEAAVGAAGIAAETPRRRRRIGSSKQQVQEQQQQQQQQEEAPEQQQGRQELDLVNSGSSGNGGSGGVSGGPPDTSGRASSSSSSSSSSVVSRGVQHGRVHELQRRQQPPPAHEGVPVMYALRNAEGWWYIGETQELRKRLLTHRRSHGRDLVLWYTLLQPALDRKVVQGHMIRAADALGLPLHSNRDAAMARGK